MANELTIGAPSATYSKNGKRQVFSGSSLAVTVTENVVIDNVQSIGTSAEALALGDVAVPGWCRFKNLDATNYVEIGFDDSGFVTFLKLLKGEETGWMRISQAAPYARANTGAVLLDYTIVGT